MRNGTSYTTKPPIGSCRVVAATASSPTAAVHHAAAPRAQTAGIVSLTLAFVATAVIRVAPAVTMPWASPLIIHSDRHGPMCRRLLVATPTSTLTASTLSGEEEFCLQL